MRILFIAPTPFFSDRGCHVRIYEVTKALSRRGHQTRICTYGLGRDMPGVHIGRCYNFPWYRKRSAGPSLTKMLLLPVLLLRAAREVRSFRPDVVHCFLHEGALVGKALSVVWREPICFFDMQGSLVDELCAHGFIRSSGALYALFVRCEAMICRFFPVVTQSNNLIAFLSSRGVAASRRINVGDGVDTVRFYPRPFPEALAQALRVDEQRPRLVYMGLLEEYQGVDVMLLAVRKARERIPDMLLVVAGYPNVETYRRLTREYGIEDNVLFVGKVPYEKAPEYLALADVALAPKMSVSEGNGKVYNYMAMGHIVIAFDCGTTVEILADSGVYVPLGDVERLAARIVDVLTHLETYVWLGRRARQRAVRDLSWDGVGRRIEGFYGKHGAIGVRTPKMPVARV